MKDLKMAAPNISRSLTRLLNESLSTGKFPSVWKTTKVTPLFKGGTTTDCDNYRPISVLPNYQYKGVGSLLMRAALDELKLSGASGCILVGDPKYYGRFGFNNVPDLVYPGVPAEYFQALKFRGSFPVGTVSYHDAFGSATSHL